MTAHVTDGRPFHQRMDGAKVKHLANVLKHLCNGTIGFDIYRDERTKEKHLLVSYIRDRYSNEAIDAAHSAVVATYGGNFNTRGRGSRRSFASAGNGASETNSASSDNGASEAQAADAAELASELSATNEADKANEATAAAVQSLASTGAAGDIGAQIALLFQSLAASQINEPKVRAIVADAVANVTRDMQKRIDDAVASATKGATVVELKRTDLPPLELGRQHENFPLLLKACHARLRDGHRLNVWLAGPAGTGKTTAARNVAKALELAFRFNGAIDSPYKLTGYTDANGRTVRTAFREAWEHGGVYLFDEVDASSPGAILEFNAALANGVCSFPDAIIPRHPDCIVIAGANTTGLGASLEYVGRMKQDAAFLDRFVVIDWPLDEALENGMCANEEWLRRVRKVRANVKARGVKGALISPRASVYGEALLAAGIDLRTVEAMTLRKGMANDQWSMVQ